VSGIDWVIVGAPAEGGRVVVLASQQLTAGQLDMVRDEYVSLGRWTTDRYLPPKYTLQLTMRQYVVIIADSYPEALRRLMEQWTPTPPERQQLDHRREIEP
jgi:hypothetical protein